MVEQPVHPNHDGMRYKLGKVEYLGRKKSKRPQILSYLTCIVDNKIIK